MALCKRCGSKGLFLKVDSEGLCYNCKDLLSKSACPYCGVILEKIPKRQSPCPDCNNIIFVRNKKMVTEKKALMLDFIKSNEFYGANENEYKIMEEELTKKFGFEPNSRDIIWSYYNKLVSKNAGNYQNLKSLYYSMALMLNKEKKDCFHLLQLAQKMELLDYEKSGFIKKVVIRTAGEGNACDNCLKLHNKTFTIKDALEKMPLPNKDCTHVLYDENRGFCRCIYVSGIDSITSYTNSIM